jgi:hypothetical protein
MIVGILIKNFSSSVGSLFEGDRDIDMLLLIASLSAFVFLEKLAERRFDFEGSSNSEP